MLVLNRSRTLPAALPAQRETGEAIQLRVGARRPGHWDVLAVQPFPPHHNVPLDAGERLMIDGVAAGVEGRRSDVPLLWRLPGSGLDLMLRTGEPVRYSYVRTPVSLEHYQTVYADDPGSAEAPSAGRAFSWELLSALSRHGIATAHLTLHAGLSSFQDDAFDAEHHLIEEWFDLSPQVASAVNSASRVIAVGTTVVRALETVVGSDGRLSPRRGWTTHRVDPASPPRAVDALLTGFHEPQASHFDLLRAFVPDGLLERAYSEAVERRYLWHEFGDLMLVL